MTVLALLLAVLAVVVVGAMLLIGAHSASVQIAKWLERFIDTAT
jgi:type IV secretory pathway VirB2 component (pilin)